MTRLLDHQQASAPAAGKALGPVSNAEPSSTGLTGAPAPAVPATVGDAAATTGSAGLSAASAAFAVPSEAEKQAAFEAELAKRKARAERFGIIPGADAAGTDAAKKQQRAERFGATLDFGTDLGALDSALADGKGRRGQGQGRKGQAKGQSADPTSLKGAAPAPAKEATEAELAELERRRKRQERFGGGAEDLQAPAKKLKT